MLIFSYSFDPYQLLEQAKPISLPLTFTPQNRDQVSWEALFLTYILNARFHLQDGYPHHLQQRFKGASIKEAQWRFIDHHLAHAASAFCLLLLKKLLLWLQMAAENRLPPPIA
ncbi:hypothetical protein LWM68_16555 [Niabella sp. W65]|nr:hypothetical protein [Niabella sp. W65]MCH7364223.1 hypothetical protein [Niabella sp. W65]ULT40092.1 hypothetical protein KRR40_35405 [Niabella sp. I65]